MQILDEKYQPTKSLLNRIKELTKRENITITELERLIGASKGVLSRALNKGTDIQSKWLIKIVDNFQQYNPEWLLTGKGEMLRGGPVPDRPEPVPAVQQDGTGDAVPLVEWPAAAGFGNEQFAIEPKDIKAYFKIPKFRLAKPDFLIEVAGESMIPTFLPGDVIAARIISDKSFVQWNRPHLIATREQGMMIKRIKPGQKPDTLKMVSDNPEYDPFEVPKSDITGLALIVGLIRLV